MKKLLLKLLVLCLALCCAMCVFTACGGGSGDSSGGGESDDWSVKLPENLQPSEGLKYALINDGTEYEVVGIDATCTDTDIVIPSSYENLPVTRIGRWAFGNCNSITSVVIPNSVTGIIDYAFCNCDSLTSVIFEEDSQLNYIAEEAFSNCDTLASVIFNEGSQLTYIHKGAFVGCTSLSRIKIPSGVISIGQNAFYNCISLIIYCESESKPSGWDSTWNSSNKPIIWDCNNNDVANDGYNYTVIDGLRYGIKDGVATVAQQLVNITTANIKSSITYKGRTYNVTSIGSSAFFECTSLTSITIPNSVTSMGMMAFYGCGITSIEIPSSVKSISAQAFWNCKSLTSVVIPNSVTSIGTAAFDGCTLLESIVIPNSVTNIKEQAFWGCWVLTIYCEAESKPSGWSSDWNTHNRPVVWGYKG